MRSRSLMFLCMLIAACTDGPETPSSYDGPAVVLTFNFKDPPNEAVTSAALQVSPVSFSPGAYEPRGSTCSGSAGVLEAFVAEGARFEIPSLGSSQIESERVACGVRDPAALHFFKVSAFVAPASGSHQYKDWTPGAYDLVYAPAPTVYRPFGPTGPSTTFPEGYSWLRRGCTPAGATELSVVSTSEAVDLHPVDTGPWMSVEISERSVLEACGVRVPPVDLGVRVAFDRAQSLVWAADGASLFYLSVPDAQDRIGAVGVRQVRLAEQSVSELAVVPHATQLQIAANDALYVSSDGATVAVDLSAGAPAAPRELPIGGFLSLSPDGLWLVHQIAEQQHLWSVAAAADVSAIEGWFLGWSPDSRLVYGPAWSPLPPQSPVDHDRHDFFVFAPAFPEASVHCGTLPTMSAMAGALAWSSECPQFIYPPLGWSIESSIPSPDCENCFGLSVQDPKTGADRPILDPSAGLTHVISTRPVAGFSFVWSRSCQGLYNTICSHTLLRVRLADGTVDTVAVADQELPVALSWDNRRLALAASNGIFVKDLPP